DLPAGPGSGEDGGGSLAGAGVPGRLGEGPTPEPGGDPKAGSGRAPGAGPHPSQDPSTVHKLAQATFDLAEALNQNLRDLKMIVDRSQERLARLEELLRLRRAQQGAGALPCARPPEGGQISASQAAGLVFAIVLPPAVLYLPSLHAVVVRAGVDGRISMLVGAGTAMLLLLVSWALAF